MKKEDKLEQFVNEHREAFDDASPSPELWARIESTLPEEKVGQHKPGMRWLRIAAIFILGAISYGVVDYFVRNESNTSMKGKTIAAAEFIKNQSNKRYGIIEAVESSPEVSPQLQTADNHPAEQPIQNNASKGNEFAEMQNYYAMQIQLRRNEIFRFAPNDPEIEQQINFELSSIDSVFNSMKNDLKDNMDNQDVIEAMILNYRVRLELLDVILQELKEKSAVLPNKNNSHEI